MTRPLLLLSSTVLGLALLGAPAATAGPTTSPSAAAFQSAKHKHQWVKKPRQVKVPPTYKKVQIGTDKNGKPIYEKVLVDPGGYKTVYETCCSICGRKK